jgi:hypothetical protein
MKTAVDKNESELDKLKREAFEWMEHKHIIAPPIVHLALEAYGQRSELTDGEIKQKAWEIVSILPGDCTRSDAERKCIDMGKWVRDRQKGGKP